MKELETVDTKIKVMISAGATREKSWVAVAKALNATKMTVDKHGEEHVEEDHTVRLRAAELIARATGDIKPDGAISVISNTITITAAEFKNLLEADRKTRPAGQSGEIIDVQSYRV